MRNHELAKFSSSWHRLVIVLLCGLALPAAAEDVKKTLGDWQLVCEDDSCRIRQGLANPEQPGVVYGSELQFAADGSQLVLTLSFPLGIYLPPGIGLSAGEQKREAPVAVCLPEGCKAIILVDDELSVALNGEESYSVRVYITEERPAEVEFSLTGYRFAYDELVRSR